MKESSAEPEQFLQRRRLQTRSQMRSVCPGILFGAPVSRRRRYAGCITDIETPAAYACQFVFHEATVLLIVAEPARYYNGLHTPLENPGELVLIALMPCRFDSKLAVDIRSAFSLAIPDAVGRICWIPFYRNRQASAPIRNYTDYACNTLPLNRSVGDVLSRDWRGKTEEVSDIRAISPVELLTALAEQGMFFPRIAIG